MTKLPDFQPLELESFEQAYTMLTSIRPDPTKGEPDFFFQEEISLKGQGSITLLYGCCGTMNDTLELAVFQSTLPNIETQHGCTIHPFTNKAMVEYMRMFYLIQLVGDDPNFVNVGSVKNRLMNDAQFTYICPDTPAVRAYLAKNTI